MTTRTAKASAATSPTTDPSPDEDLDQNGPSPEPSGDDKDPLDHDGDGRKGGSAPAPEVTHLVVIKSDTALGLSHGEVVGTADAHVKDLLAANVARAATETEVELAQPRVRLWSPPAA